ncbi:MAG: DNA translocase FtsK [Rikenellaceae bacterium]|jgi:S-DNA-T family DNA segregation ATPase FtsK/SpoIIIE|nr:DNA translocase FtsK [Rikenellaceae bacterium]
MRFRPMVLRRSVRISLVLMILGSLFMGFFFGTSWNIYGSGLGGAHGIIIAQWLTGVLGWAGTLLLLVCAAVLLAVYITRSTILFVNKVGKGLADGSAKVGGAVGHAIGQQAANLVGQVKHARDRAGHDDAGWEPEHTHAGHAAHPQPVQEFEPVDAGVPLTGALEPEPVAEVGPSAETGPTAFQTGHFAPVTGALEPEPEAAIAAEPSFEVVRAEAEPPIEGPFAVVGAEEGDIVMGIEPGDGVTSITVEAAGELPDGPFEVVDSMRYCEEDGIEIVERTAPQEVGSGVLGAGGVTLSDGTAEGMEVLQSGHQDAELDEDEIDSALYDPTLELSKYQRPPVEILEDHRVEVQVTEEELRENNKRIVDTLKNFGIGIGGPVKATVGPTVTLYEIIPAPGVRISKIKNLEDDIALSLSALGIRIIAPMPGKGTIGIEVPNKDKEIVSMYSVIRSQKFQESTYDLPVVLGKTIQNETFTIDLAKMPHLLVAGATGQGKSVGLNAIITSLLYKKHPAELKFVLVDPKKVELTLYQKLERHFLAGLPDADETIITDTQKVIYTLNSLCVEMDSRYDLLRKAEVRHVKEYNDKFVNRRLNPNRGHRYLPYIVVVIDEFADMIMTAGREIETPIARVAQLARAVGIHLVIATQRPTTNIITGVIKANFPARIAFRVSSMIDSRTIIDGPGANQLIGRGDMLVSTGSDIVRVQCAFIDTPEIERITEFIGNQRGYGEAYQLPEYVPEGEAGGKNVDMDHIDAMFADVARFVVQHQQGSTSAIQRRFSIGYNRAGKITDQMEVAGIVGSASGSKPREVLITDMASLEQLLLSIM